MKGAIAISNKSDTKRFGFPFAVEKPRKAAINNYLTNLKEIQTMSVLTNIGKEITSDKASFTRGLEKIDINEVIVNYGTVTLNGVNIGNKDGNRFTEWTFLEDVSAFFFGGKVLTDICDAWIQQLGDLACVNEELGNNPVKVKLERAKSSTGRFYTKVTFVD